MIWTILTLLACLGLTAWNLRILRMARLAKANASASAAQAVRWAGHALMHADRAAASAAPPF